MSDSQHFFRLNGTQFAISLSLMLEAIGQLISGASGVISDIILAM